MYFDIGFCTVRESSVIFLWFYIMLIYLMYNKCSLAFVIIIRRYFCMTKMGNSMAPADHTFPGHKSISSIFSLIGDHLAHFSQASEICNSHLSHDSKGRCVSPQYPKIYIQVSSYTQSHALNIYHIYNSTELTLLETLSLINTKLHSLVIWICIMSRLLNYQIVQDYNVYYAFNPTNLELTWIYINSSILYKGAKML